MKRSTGRSPATEPTWRGLCGLVAAVLGLSTGPAVHAAGEYDCITEPSQSVEVRAAVTGLIARITVGRGDVVEAGQVLVALDTGLEEANVALARFRATMEGAMRAGESRREYAELKASRSSQLHAERYVSAETRDEALTELRLAEAELLEIRDNQRSAELEYDRARELLAQRIVRAPIEGIVVERLMQPGELADNSDTRRPILKLANISVLHVEALLPLEAYHAVQVGQAATVMLEEPVGGRHTATVTVVDRVVDTASGTFGVRLELSNPDHEIPAGVKCRVSFAATEPERP